MTQRTLKLQFYVTNGPGKQDLHLSLADYGSIPGQQTRRFVEFGLIPVVNNTKHEVSVEMKLLVWITRISIPRKVIHADEPAHLLSKIWDLEGREKYNKHMIKINEYSTLSRIEGTAVIPCDNSLQACWPFVAETVIRTILSRFPEVGTTAVYDFCGGVMRLEGVRILGAPKPELFVSADLNSTAARRSVQEIVEQQIQLNSNCFVVVSQCHPKMVTLEDIDKYPFVQWTLSMISD